jgi:hypothetical protein
MGHCRTLTLIWHALVNDLPLMLDSLQRWIDATDNPPSTPTT